jgi:hypothetical protein
MKERGTIQEWWYEPFTLILTKKGKRKTTYTPDFLVINHAGAVEIHEVKGFWRGDARVKFKMAVDLNPWAEFKVITRKTKNSPWREEDWS